MADGGESMSYVQIMSLTLEAVLQTVFICLIGYWASRSGHMSRSAQKVISNLNVMVFTPCLIFSKMASRLSVSALVDISVVPIIFVLGTGISYLCGRATSRFFGLNLRETNFVIAMAVFGNSNSVPVSLFLGLASSLPALQWPDIPNDNSENVASRGLLYLLIFQQLGQMLRWSWGFNTLLAPDVLEPAQVDIANSEASPRPSDAESSGPKTPLWKLVILEIRAFMNPPLWSMLAAICVASVPALRYELYGHPGLLNKTFGQAVQQVGATAVPLILVVLGSNLAPPGEEDAHFTRRSRNYSKIIAASIVSRMILPCLIMLPIIALAVRYLGISILDDPTFLVTSFILTAAPPAIQLSQICQLNQVFEAEMAGVLFWGYAVLSLPSAIVIVMIALEVLEWTNVSVSTLAATAITTGS